MYEETEERQWQVYKLNMNKITLNIDVIIHIQTLTEELIHPFIHPSKLLTSSGITKNVEN